MTNYEKHRIEIEPITRLGMGIAIEKETGKIVPCNSLRCSECLFKEEEKACSYVILEWADAEYIEPEEKNGPKEAIPEEKIKPNKAIEQENPKRTRKDVLLEKFPKAIIAKSGEPTACAYDLGLNDDCKSDCAKCWNTEVEE